MGREFAQQYPKIASRLALDTTDIPDPYVERLLEGVSFLTARTQLKLDAEYPRFVQRILEVVYPDFINQKPAAAIVNLEAYLAANCVKAVAGRACKPDSFVISTVTSFMSYLFLRSAQNA